MILEKQKESMVHQEGESQESIGMSLDLDSAQILMQMLSKNLYSDDIGSTIRECASNALDSHRRAGVDKPIVVSLTINKEDNYEFSVEDFGTGLDADDVKNIISKYGKSTKRNSATELGMMGLGFKAPLAYSSSFYFVCRKDGMERKYMMYEGEDVNTIDLLYEAPTDQPNGVKVIVPLKPYDKHTFIRKIKEQLAYFESVYFDVPEINNDFVITRHEFFQFSELASNNYLHICLDNVYYPIDFEKLGIDTLRLPVALRFSLTDGIFPTPNRESIRYTQEAKAVILKRLQQASNYFIEKYNETVKETADLKTIIDYFDSDYRYLKVGNSSWDVHPLSKFATIDIAAPKLKGINLLDMQQLVRLQEYMLGEYDAKFYVNGKTMREAKRYYGATSIKKLSRTVYVYEGDKISGLKKDYLKSIQPDKYTDSLIVRKSRSFPLRSKNGRGDYDNYYTMLKLGKHPKSEWRQRIQEFQSIINGYTSQFVNIDTLEVPQSFIDARKKQRISTGQIKGTGVASGPRRVKLKGEMICKQAVDLERWVDGKNCKWVSKTYDMAKFHQNPFLLIYGKQEDMDKMDKWFRPTRSLKIELAVLSERELKLVEKIELHNLMSFSKFMEGKNKKFQRIATACFIDKLTDDYKYVFRNVEALQPISTDLHDKVVSLTNYRNVNFRSLDDDIRDTIIEHAKENKAFDLSMYSTAVEIENICKKLPFLDAMMSNIRYYGDLDSEKPLLTALKDLFKYHKHRIDWKNYRIRFNEDLPLEETLTSETVEQLVQQD
jgi:hypothetical protein